MVNSDSISKHHPYVFKLRVGAGHASGEGGDAAGRDISIPGNVRLDAKRVHAGVQDESSAFFKLFSKKQ